MAELGRLGRVMAVKLVHPSKQLLPKLVTELGMVIVVNPSHPEKQ